MKNGLILKWGLKLQHVCCFGPVVHKLVYKEVRLIYDVFQNFVVCSNYALDLLASFKAVDQKFIRAVMTEAKANIEEARDAIVNLRSGYPNIMKQVDQ